ncbi:MAG: glycosyltransferase family 4 protein [Alphaproteobacteria bacterium]|nr:glycosyltransferase family 4 protein [Alphaproteobacteria bacterium]
MEAIQPKRPLVQILLEGLPKYRSVFLTRLKQSGRIDFKLYPAHQADPGLFDNSVAGAFADAIVQPTRPAKEFLGGRFSWHSHFKVDPDLGQGDVIVCAGNPRFLNIYPLTIAARRLGLPVIWWCQGWTPEASPATTKIRHWLTRRFPDAVMVYTEKEAKAFVELGFPKDRTFFLNNTIDETLVQAAIDRVGADALGAFRQREGLDGRKLLLFCSRLTPKTRLLQAIDAVERLRADHPDVLLAVIGDGVLRAEAENKVKAVGLANHVRFLGAMFDEDQLAPWFLSAQCLLYPGPIGLSLLHAFAYGLPVVTHDNPRNQNPEIAALEPGANGLTFKENDVADFASALGRILAEPAFQSALGERARTTAHRDYTMAAMVRNFEQAVFAMSGRRAAPASLAA